MENLKNLLCDPTQLGLAVLLFVLAAISVPVLVWAEDDACVAADVDGELVDRMQGAIAWLMRKAPARPLARSEKLRLDLARDFIAGAQEYDNDPWLILAMGFRESSFRPDVIGTKDERGIMQTMDTSGCDMTTVRGQILCGSKYLRKARNRCGSLRRALNAYLSKGGSCSAVPGGPVSRAVNRRLRLARRMQIIIQAPRRGK